MLTTATINSMLDNALPSGSGNTQLSAHTAYSTSGANLVTSSKTDANFSAAASRAKSLSAACDIPIGAATTVQFVGAWNAGGSTFKGMVPNGSTGYFTFQLDVTNNKVYAEGCGFANGDQIVFVGDTAPTGLTEGTVYYVVGMTAADPDNFQVAATAGGSAIDITGQHAADCCVSKIVPEVYAATGTHRVSSLTFNG